MKKTYQKPEIEIVTVQNADIICTSLTEDASGNPTQDLGEADKTEETSGNLSRWRNDEMSESEEPAFGNLW